MAVLHVDHVLSTELVDSPIFDDLIRRAADAAPAGVRVTRSIRPSRSARVHHYHRANLERRLLPRSVVSIHHDLRDPRPSLALDNLLPRCREARSVHCLNATQAKMLAEHGIRHTHIIPHGIDRRVLPLPQRPRRWGGGRLRLGLFSRRYGKGVKGEALLEGLLGSLDPHRIVFLMIGEDRRHEAALARSRGFEVDCWEHLPYRLMRDAVAAIDALLIVSRREGGPASLPEALGSGVPVLCTPVGMCLDQVRDGDNGLFLSGDPEADGARVMALLAANGRGIAALFDGAFAGAAAIPDWAEAMAGWHRLYADAAA
jgi:glycosyltransferase involved in cell wall biosynthesis